MSAVHHLGPLAQIEPGSAKRVEIAGRSVALVRIGDDVYALGDRCSHGDASLSAGEVWCDEQEIECPKHGSRFSLVTGHPDSLPATQPVALYEVRVVNGEIEVVVS
jgi:3-phenylpropionate/trans-cinnamate dioxygenase ferredoxin subunit